MCEFKKNMEQKKSDPQEKHDKMCFYCQEKIDLNSDQYTIIGDYKGDRVIKESYFHFKCFVEFWNKKVNEKARNNVGGMQKKAKDVLGNLMDGNIGGMGGLGSVGKLAGSKKLNKLLGGALNKDLTKNMPQIEDIFDFEKELICEDDEEEDKEEEKQETKKPQKKKTTKKKTTKKKNGTRKKTGR